MDLIQQHLPLSSIATALIAMNLAAFAAFGLDKALATAGQRRIAEATLLWLAALGGTPGTYAGRALFRHKTCKQPFSSRLFTILLVQVVVAAGVLIGWSGIR